MSEDLMDVCVIAGMSDYKLESKLAPIQANERLARIHLIRRRPFSGDKVDCHSPPRVVCRVLPLAELWRLVSLTSVAIRKRPRCLIALGTIPHGFYAWGIGRLLGIPVIQHVMADGNIRMASPSQRGKRVALAAVRSAAGVAVRGSRMKERLQRKGVSAERLFVPQNTHDFELFSPDETVRKGYDLIYVGELRQSKRVDVLLDAFAQARPRLDNPRLLLVGDGPLREQLEARASVLGLGASVTFAGIVPHRELPRYLRQARAFILTSEDEGLPMAMIEALTVGLPVIVPAVADVEDAAKHRENSLVVPILDTGGFANAIVELLGDEQLFAQLVAGAMRFREAKQQEYSLEYQTDLWDRALDQVLEGAERAG